MNNEDINRALGRADDPRRPAGLATATKAI